MPRQRIFTFGDFEGRGKSLTEARDNCMLIVERALRGTFTPRIIRWRSVEVLIWREPAGGWHTKILRADCFENGSPFTRELEGGATLLVCSSSSCAGDGGDEGLDRTIQGVLANIAQLAWDGVELESPLLTDKAAVSEFRSWATFQINYKAIKAEHEDWNDTMIRAHMWQNRM